MTPPDWDRGDALDLGAVVVALLVWVVLYAGTLYATRVRAVRASAPTQDFGGAEPPAVVNLLASGWRINEDAVEATVLDLAARRYLEFRQAGDDPTSTTVHLPPRPPVGATPLTPYETQVLERVRSLAVGAVVPLTALTFRDAAEAHRWNRRFTAEVVSDAVARGLSRRRVSRLGGLLLSGAAIVVGVVVALALAHHDPESLDAAPGAGLITFGALAAVANRDRGQRDTDEGRRVAARWLGLRAYLRGDDAFAALPPAAVAVWDRYLSYGDALGVTHVCAAVLDLGMGDRTRVWSSHGGSWRRVRVRYPRWGLRFGHPAWRLGLGGVVTLAAGLWLAPRLGATPGALVDGADRPGQVIALVVLALIAWGAYRSTRVVHDLVAVRTITGQVLWQELWRSTQPRGDDRPAEPWLDYLAVDDGSSDRTTAWALPRDLRPSVSVGDTVTLTVRPWSRRVTSLVIVESRAAEPRSDVAAAAAPGASPAHAVAGSGDLLSEAEVSAALGLATLLDGANARIVLGPFAMSTYVGAGGQGRLMTTTTVRGMPAQVVLRSARTTGRQVPGLADEAWLGDTWAMARTADQVVRLTLEGAALTASNSTATDPGLTQLLRLAVARLPAPATPSA